MTKPARKNPFAIQKQDSRILKIRPKEQPIVCRTNCSSHGSITDPASSKRFEGLQFFPLRIDETEAFYENEKTKEVGREILTFLVIILAEKCRVSSLSDGEELAIIPPGTIMYFQLKRNKSLSGSTDNFLQMKSLIESSGASIIGCVVKPSFVSCTGTINGEAVSYAKCHFNGTTATEERHIEILNELFPIWEADPLFESILPIDNAVMKHYDAIASKYEGLKSLPGLEAKKQLTGS